MGARFAGLLLVVASAAASAAEYKQPPLHVEVAPVKRVEMAPQMKVPGTVLSRQDAQVATEVSGRLVQMAEAGDVVVEGDILARIDDRDWSLALQDTNAEILRLVANVGFLKSEAERLARLMQTNSAARSQFENVNSQHAMAEQDLARATIKRDRTEYSLARTRVRAPFAGQVVERLVEPGEFTTVGMPLLRLVNTSNLEIRAQAPIAVAPYLEKGMQVLVSGVGEARRLTVFTIIPVGDFGSRSFEIRLAVPASSWVIGTPVRVSLPTDVSRAAVVVPRDALVLRERGVYVFKVEGENRVEQVLVTTGMGSGDLIEVVGAVQVGDQVVIRGAERLRDGSAIHINSAGS